MEGKITNAADALKFMFAGNAIFTLRSTKTGARYTYRVRVKESDNPNQEAVHFVSYLFGGDNTKNYKYLCMVSRQKYVRLTKASKESGYTMETEPIKVFAWALEKLIGGVEMKNFEVWHEGRCGRCGRLLTVPESIASGIGPDCAEKAGIIRVELPINPAQARIFPVEEAEPARYTPTHEDLYERDEDLESEVEDRIAALKESDPEAYYQDGMLDDETAPGVWRNKFMRELKGRR